jgi:chromosomal replication initiator protein
MREEQAQAREDFRPQWVELPTLSEGRRAFDDAMQSLRRKVNLFVWQGFFEILQFQSFEDNCFTVGAPTLFHRDWVRDHYLHELKDALSISMQRIVHVTVVALSPEKTQAQLDAEKEARLTDNKNDLHDRDNADVVLLHTPASAAAKSTLAPMPAPAPMPTPAAALSSSAKTPAALLRPTPKLAPQLSEVRGLKIDAAPKLPFDHSSLNANYTFNSFVPGPSNQMAFSACSAVAEKPGNQYSPLFLFGPVGIGKTHLLHALGLQAKTFHPDARVVYMSAEQWVNAYIHSIRERNFDDFRRRFRSFCDVLLIDDIQFLAGKDASQDEFFHTFNCLHQARKQIVVTSDKYPHEIEGLEDRLKTRLSWGLIADIRPPEIETRMAILYKRAEQSGFCLAEDVAHYLAVHVASSVRELEGALLRLLAYSEMHAAPISLQLAKEHLAPVLRKNPSELTPERIVEVVASYYDLRSSDLAGQSRQRQLTLARQIAMAFCRNYLSMSLPEIGRLFGGRDHTTVLSSIRKMEHMRENDISVRTVYSRLEKSLIG